jgi:protein TonB
MYIRSKPLAAMIIGPLILAASGQSLATDPVPIMAENWITLKDYPESVIRPDPYPEGRVEFTLTVTVEGKASACKITKSSGYERLDEVTCKHLMRRARFEPAKNADGEAIEGSHASFVDWRVPD